MKTCWEDILWGDFTPVNNCYSIFSTLTLSPGLKLSLSLLGTSMCSRSPAYLETCLMNDFFPFFLRFVTLSACVDKQVFKDLCFGRYKLDF